ncbi:uncharacterized protein L969DRAFT_52262 [Mixia osmundae IAM 14324]|uniref:GOLD domain-containing protein n=1 Tax=Mixia osmundae (strain CBS 9802 / IAM 14324 / JCM 22182 / KY 12970) TaxID=764103 RepID=G7E4S0_MIXOS|nr:uncharacterized protein L969DRAFT_52262 [Mixia osmundae IAM 14324]KEI37651.1 hypothetical protein L969DRAFT_52262 [Mixia osmundae IAM 14324]GAA97830.1 hypothetical protein E5Q_04509 [Mixia osmundae IAM 14324]
MFSKVIVASVLLASAYGRALSEHSSRELALSKYDELIARSRVASVNHANEDFVKRGYQGIILTVYVPPITKPLAGVTWYSGSKQRVEWSTAKLPEDGKKQNGTLVLGYLADDSEHLMLDTPLAKDFKLGRGHTYITVPDVPERDDYILCLFGDSGNISALFTIKPQPPAKRDLNINLDSQDTEVLKRALDEIHDELDKRERQLFHETLDRRQVHDDQFHGVSV